MAALRRGLRGLPLRMYVGAASRVWPWVEGAAVIRLVEREEEANKLLYGEMEPKVRVPDVVRCMSMFAHLYDN